MDASNQFDDPVRRLRLLNSFLCDTPVKLASGSDTIVTVYNAVVGKSPDPHDWPTFNRFMDILFGDDVRNSEGRLQNVKRGPHGMDLVVDYITNCARAGTLPYDIAILKINRLIEELEILTYVPL
jgi:hypothetical protein